MALVSEEFRSITKTSTVAGQKPTVPSSADHTDGTWLVTDLYEYELFFNSADNVIYTRVGAAIVELRSGTSFVTKFGFVPNGGSDARVYDTESGSYYHRGVLYTHGAGTADITITDGDATHPRYDLIYIDESNTPKITAGTAAASPVKPSLADSTDLILGYIYVPSGYVAGTTDVQTIVEADAFETFFSGIADWATNKTYHDGQVFQDSGNLYLVLQNHVSDAIAADISSGDISEVGAGASIITRSDYTIVKSASDLPTASGGIITLTTDINVNGAINIGTDRINPNGKVIKGYNSQNDTITYTGTDSMFTGTSGSWIERIRMTSSNVAGKVFDLTDTGKTQAIHIMYCDFAACGKLGDLTGYGLIEFNNCNIYSTQTEGLNLTDNNHVTFRGCNFFAGNHGIYLDLRGTTNSIMITDCILHANLADLATAIDVTNLTAITSGLIFGGLFRGDGSMMSGTFGANWNVLSDGSTNYHDLNAQGMVSLTSSTATTIAGVNTPVKVAGTTSSYQLLRFDTTGVSNRLRYIGVSNNSFLATATVTFTSASNNTIWAFQFWKNGVKIPQGQARTSKPVATDFTSVSLSAIIDFAPNDYIELYVTNATDSSNVTIIDLTMTAK